MLILNALGEWMLQRLVIYDDRLDRSQHGLDVIWKRLPAIPDAALS